MLEWSQWDEFNFYRNLADTGGRVLVMFSSPDCGSCRHLERRLPGLLDGHLERLVRVNVQQATALAREYAVFHLPQLFLFINGEFHAPVQAPVTDLPAALATLARQPAREAP